MISLLLMQLQFEIVGPCSEKPLLNKWISTGAVTVGDATIETLNKFKVPYLGTERGMNSIYNTPTDDRTLEVISNSEMRSYGWCFEIDGQVSEEYPSDIPLDQSMKKIKWFYGFAHYKSGKWVSQCEYAHTQKPRFACENR